MAITRVSGSHAVHAYGDSASARTLAYGGALTSGSLLTCIVTCYGPNTVTVADDINGSYTNTPAGYITVGAQNLSLWYVQNTSAGTPTVTVTPSASAAVALSLDEFTGATSALRNSTGQVTTSTAIPTGTVTATAGDLVVAGMGQASSLDVVSSVDAPFTLSANTVGSGVQALATAYDLAAPGDEGCTFNLPSSIPVMAIAASFPPASGQPAMRRIGRTPLGVDGVRIY